MSKPDVWMPLYVGDYLADTMHLTTQQHGAYLLLLMHYWRTGPLPNDDGTLASIAKVERREWATRVGPAVRRFFDAGDDGLLHQKRADREMSTASSSVEQRRAAGKASAKARAARRAADETANEGSDEMANDNPTAVATEAPTEAPTEPQRNARPSPSPSSLRSESLRATARELEIIFNTRFWPLYPRKDEKIGALKAFQKACKTAAPEEIIQGLKRYRFSPDPQYLPMPTTWLNGGRWLSENGTDPPGAGPTDRGIPGIF